jgi:hypothetical protein
MTTYSVGFDIKNMNGQLLRAGDVHANTLSRLVQNFSNVSWLLGMHTAETVSPRAIKWIKQDADKVWYSDKFNVQVGDLSIVYWFRKA